MNETITWCDVTPKQADELLAYVLKKGNFGKRDSGNSKTVVVMKKFRNPITAIKYMTAAGTKHWKAARKYPFLRIFAWIYQIGHL